MFKFFTPKNLALLLAAAALTASAQIRKPLEVTSEMQVMTLDPITAAVGNTQLSFKNTVMVNAFGQEITEIQTMDDSNPAPGFQIGIDPVKKYAAIIKCVSNEAVVTIPDEISYQGVAYPVTIVMKGAFAAKTNLTTLNFGKNVKSVDTQVFVACSKLQTVNFNEGLIEIGKQAFQMMCSNVKSLTLPASLEIIGENAFAGTGLQGEFIINKNLREIGPGAFAGKKITGFYICEEGNAYFTSKDGVLYTKDGESLVMFPPALVEPTLTIPAGTKKLYAYAFANCSNVTKFVIPESLEEIGNYAFRDCGITEFVVGKNIKKIGCGVFRGNKKLTSLTVEDGNIVFTASDGLLVNNLDKALIATAYTVTDINVPSGIDSIAPDLCYQNPGVKSLIAPASVKSIGASAFQGCTGITSIVLPGVVTIGQSAFSGGKNLAKVDFPATLRTLDIHAFSSNTGLTEINFKDGVDSIGGGAFQNCTALVKANLPGTVKKMGDVIFYGCTALNELALGEGLPYIPANMAYGCTKLYFVTFPSTIKEIRNGAFSMSWLQEAVLPEGLEKIGASAFQLCPLKDITIPNSVTEVGEFGFSITNAKFIKCGTGLKKVGQNGFQGNKQAEYIELNEGLEQLDFRALYGEKLISEITIPSTVKVLGDSCLIMTRLTKLTNKAKVPQPLKTAITWMTVKTDWNSYIGDIYDTCTLCVPEDSKDAYANAEIWKLYKNITTFPSAGIDGIENDEAEATIVEIYGIDGRKRPDLEKGINICVMSNGKVKKIAK